jgi:hypothetical protein
MFFPLKLTSVYENKKIPINIYVMSHVTPELYSEIYDDTQVSYFTQSVYTTPQALKSFFNNKSSITNLEYTKIKINTESSSFVNDLWINNHEPAGVTVTKLFNFLPWLWSIIFFILISCFSSMISGMIIFREHKPSKKFFFSIGLSNILTIIGFFLYSLNKINKKLKQESEKSKIEILYYTIGFLIIQLIVLTLNFSVEFILFIFYLPAFLVITVPLVLFTSVISLIIKKVFNPNKKVVYFTIIFSIIFLLLSWFSMTMLNLIPAGEKTGGYSTLPGAGQRNCNALCQSIAINAYNLNSCEELNNDSQVASYISECANLYGPCSVTILGGDSCTCDGAGCS